jgi:hypothetical protein
VKLGDILTRSRKGQAVPAPTTPLTFKVLGRDEQGVRTTTDARAVLAFVDDDERNEALRQAEKELRAEFPDGNVPLGLLSEERNYHVLAKGLRDEDDPRAPFADSVKQLRGALHHMEYERIVRAYEDFLEEEFPETPTPEQLDQLIEEAAKNSFGGLLTSYDLRTIRRALPFLVARFGRSPMLTSGAGTPAA